MSNLPTYRALFSVWPGSGLPKVSQSRTAHGTKTSAATRPGVRASRRRSYRRTDGGVAARPAVTGAATGSTLRPGRPRQTIASQANPNQMASLRVSAARPRTAPRATSRRLGIGFVAPDPKLVAMRVIRRQAASARRAKRAVESGRAPYRTSGPSRLATRPVPTPSVRARPDRQSHLRGNVRAEPPRQHRHHGAGQNGDDLRTSEPVGRAQYRHRHGREERRQRHPDLESRPRHRQRLGLVAPQAVADRGHVPRRRYGPLRRSRPCPRGRGSRPWPRRPPGPPGRPRRRRRR